MKKKPSPPIAQPATQAWQGRTIVAGLLAMVAYAAAYMHDFTPFLYFPFVGEFHWSRQPAALGPGITFYAWCCVGLIVGLTGLLLPRRWAERVPPDAAWLGTLGVTAVVVAHEVHWFFQ